MKTESQLPSGFHFKIEMTLMAFVMHNDCTKHTEYNFKLVKSWMKGDKALALMTTIKRFLLLAESESGGGKVVMR